MAGVTLSGFVPLTQTEIETLIKTALWADISPTLDLSSASLLGEFVGIVSSHLAQLWEASQHVYAGMDLDQALGERLTALCRALGVVREGATASTVLMSLTLAAGTYLAGTLVVHVVGDPSSVFANDAAVTSPGGVVTGVPFTCTQLGPVRANSGTLTVIANPIGGFTAATNPLDAVLGSAVEGDLALKLRARTELARRGSHTVDAIRADLLEVDGVTFVAVYENDTNVTDGFGRPAKSFEALVVGGTNQDVLDALLVAKPAGIQAVSIGGGAVNGTALDSQGTSHALGFTRPTVVPVYVDVTVVGLTGGYVGDSALEVALVEWADSTFGVGQDVILNKVIAFVMSQPGVVDCTVEIGPSAGAGTVAATFVIGPRDVPNFDVSQTTVTSTLVNAAP